MITILKLSPAPDDAAALLDLLASDEPVTFQTFDDAKQGRKGLTRVMHGTLAQHRQTLASLNARGAGIFWMVNAGDCRGRTASNVQRVRALFVDLDGAPLEPVEASSAQPHVIVESSPSRWHAYWRIADCPLADFTRLQKMLAAQFRADASVCDLPRVLRLPGFMHRKGEPFRSHIMTVNDAPPYTLAAFLGAFGLAPPAMQTLAPRTAPRLVRTIPARRRRNLPNRILEGGRNNTLMSLAGGLVRRGYSLRQTTNRMQRINTARCDPPLSADEVDGIVSRALAYGSQGFAMLPHKLLDSREWKALPPRAHDILLLAFRRYDGTSAGIALTWNDFDGLPGFGDKHTFYGHRAAVVQAGILRFESKGSNTQTGRKPDLFTIAPQWLHDSASVKNPTLRQCEKSALLHR